MRELLLVITGIVIGTILANIIYYTQLKRENSRIKQKIAKMYPYYELKIKHRQFLAFLNKEIKRSQDEKKLRSEK